MSGSLVKVETSDVSMESMENVTAEDAPVRTKMRGEIRKTACEFVAAKL